MYTSTFGASADPVLSAFSYRIFGAWAALRKRRHAGSLSLQKQHCTCCPKPIRSRAAFWESIPKQSDPTRMMGPAELHGHAAPVVYFS